MSSDEERMGGGEEEKAKEGVLIVKVLLPAFISLPLRR